MVLSSKKFKLNFLITILFSLIILNVFSEVLYFRDCTAFASTQNYNKSNKSKLVSIYVKYKNNLIPQFELFIDSRKIYYSTDKSVKLSVTQNSKINCYIASNGVLIKKNFNFTSTASIPDKVYITPNPSLDKVVNIHIYDNSKPVAYAQVFIISKDILREIYIGKTDKNGFIPLLVTKGEYYLKICYGANDSDVMEYAFTKIKIDDNKNVKLDISKFGEVNFHMLYAFGGVGLNDKLYIGLNSIWAEQKIICSIGRQRSVKFDIGNHGKVWIFGGDPSYFGMYCLAYKPTKDLIIKKPKETVDIDLEIDTQNIKILNIYRWNERNSRWERTTFSNVYEGDELRLEILIPTKSHYVLAMTGVNYYDKEHEKEFSSIACVSSIIPCKNLTAYIIDKSWQKYNIRASMSNLFNNQQNTFTVFLKDIKGTSNSKLYMDFDFSPYQFDRLNRILIVPMNVCKR